MDIREYLQKEQKGFYKIIAETLTVERRKQLYDAINEWHKSELKLLCIANVVRQSEQLVCEVCGSTDVIEAPHMGRNCNRCHPL